MGDGVRGTAGRESLRQDGDLSPWIVTISDRGEDIALEVQARDEADARAEALTWHPHGRVKAVEASS